MSTLPFRNTPSWNRRRDILENQSLGFWRSFQAHFQVPFTAANSVNSEILSRSWGVIIKSQGQEKKKATATKNMTLKGAKEQHLQNMPNAEMTPTHPQTDGCLRVTVAHKYEQQNKKKSSPEQPEEHRGGGGIEFVPRCPSPASHTRTCAAVRRAVRHASSSPRCSSVLIKEQAAHRRSSWHVGVFN